MLAPSVLALLSASLVVASPAPRAPQVITAPLKYVIHPNATAKDIIQRDLSRYGGSDHIFHNKRASAVSTSVINAVVSYLIPIKFGGSSTTYDLIVDTGSSNTWVGANQRFTCSSPCKSTGDSVSVSYGSGSFSGTEATDTVTLASGLTITGQYIGIASSSSGFSGVDGILGVGPEDLTQGTVSGISEEPTVVQTAYTEGYIPAEILGVYFAPTTTSSNNANGELTFGGTDSSKYTGSISYTSVAGSFNAYWGVSVPITIGSTSAGTFSGIVDTGTTLLYLPSTAYNDWIKAIPSATVDSNSGLVRFPKSSISSVPTIYFTVGGTKFAFNNYAQLVESGLYSAFGLSSSYYYSWVSNGGSSSLNFIIGQKFLERYYSVFDTTNNRVGFATTSNSNPTSAP